MTAFRRVWVKGPRTLVEAKDGKGRTVVRTGKKGGPSIAQVVELHLIPKEKGQC